ncbi:MAG: AraC family transcriptional regulator [Hyphomicrobiales bacterium]
MKSLPLVNLSLLRPFLLALRERGVDPEIVLYSVGLTEDAVERDDETVHVMVVHQFLEACAVATKDKTFCACVGNRLDSSGWPMLETALHSGCSLADFLTTYVTGANVVASSVTAYLDVRGSRAIYGEKRLFRPTLLPAQNDGFMVSMAVGILRRALGDQLDRKKMTLVLCDPDVLPARFSKYYRLKGDEMGFRVEFPSSWLVFSVAPPPASTLGRGSGEFAQTSQFLTDLRSLIARNIGSGGLSAEELAALVSMSRTTLARRLAKEGSTITKEIQRARLGYAREHLHSTDQPIDEIAAALGYNDPSNFTRAFRQAEGVSPRVFRHKGEPIE